MPKFVTAKRNTSASYVINDRTSGWFQFCSREGTARGVNFKVILLKIDFGLWPSLALNIIFS